MSHLKHPTKAAQRKRKGRLPGETSARENSQLVGDFLKKFGLTKKQLVQLTGYSPRSIAKWSGGTESPPQKRKFVEVDRLLTSLTELMDNPANLTSWLEAPNPAFEGMTPAQMIERGESGRLWRMIYALESGDPV